MAQTQMREGANLGIHFPRTITQTLYGYKVGYPTLHKFSSPSLITPPFLKFSYTLTLNFFQVTVGFFSRC